MPTINFDFRVRGASEVQRAVRATAQEASKITGRASQTAQQEQAATQATLRGAAARKRAATDTAKEVQKIEQQTTAIVQAEAAKRTSAEQAGYKQRVKSALAYQRDVERAEREVTRAAEREQRRRARVLRADVSAAVVGTARAVGGAVTNTHGQIQDARRTRAQTERELGVALYQTGANRGEVATRMARLTSFAQANGMDAQELAAAASAAQTQFSTLAGDTAGAREGRFEDFLRTALFARNTGNNVAETARLQGLFAQTGLDSNTQQSLLRFSAAASQAGAVEMGSVSRQALQAITSRIATAQNRLGPNASPADRSAAAVAEYRQAFAELQVEASAGLGPRQGGNALAAVNRSLQDSTRQERLLNNIRNSRDLSSQQRRELEQGLFVRTAGGRSRLRSTNALDLVSTFASKVGADSALFANTFAGSGAGNPQGLQANWRTALGALLNADTSGRTGIERVNALKNTTLSDADVRRGADIFGNDQLAQLTRNEETRLTALTDNNSRLLELSNRVSELSGRFPVLVAALAGAGGAGGIASTGLSAVKAGAGLAGAGVTTALSAAGLGGLAATLGAGVGSASAGALVAGVGGAAALGLGAGELANRALAPRNKDGSRADNETVFSAQTWRNFANAIREAFSSNPVTVQISPQAAAHAAGVAATGSDSPAPESRANR